jgi:nucleoside-diphosphate-sugar epimerase
VNYIKRAYGAAKNPGKARIISEKSPLSPKGEYEITKASADKFVINTCRESSICYTILRPSNIVGVGMPNKSFGALLRAISEGKFFFIGSKSSISNYIHVDDVVDALLICISDDRAKNKVFNLSNDCALSDIVSEVSIFTDINPKPLCVPENLVRFSVWMITKFIKLPLSKSRIDALVSRTSFPSHYIREVLGFIPSKHIPQFAVDYLKYLNETKQS